MFDGILKDLLTSVPGARGAVFCDSQGETVTSVGASGRHDSERLDDYDLRVAGAQFATPLFLANESAAQSLGTIRECIITAERETLVIHMLPERYYVVLCLAPESLTGLALHYLRQAAVVIAKEI